MKYDVVALGELLIDFTNNGVSEQGNPMFEANPGGAPCNVLSMLSKLGKKAAFIGKVGDDAFGRQLEDAIREVGIESKGLCKDKEVNTTLAFVLKLPNGDRDFSFYRKPGADMMLSKDDLDMDIIRNTRIFHFGTLSMTDDICREATKLAIDEAVKAGATVSFDPNLREPLWKSLDEAKEQVAYGLSKCNILKISDNEILWFTGKDDYDEGIEVLKKDYPNISLILLSMGPDGSRAYYKNMKVEVPAVLRDNTIETTGAGDTFCGCMLNYILDNGLTDLSEDNLREMLTYANMGASIITIRKGALRVMPTKEEIEEELSKKNS